MRMIEVRAIDKLSARALLLIGLLTALPAAAWADPWCAPWKNQQMCASVEDFQIFAIKGRPQAAFSVWRSAHRAISDRLYGQP